MRHSLEVRTPLVDRELLRALAHIPPGLRQAGPAKRRLRESPRPPVPDALWNRKKQGFTLPFEAWLRSGRVGLELPDHPCLDAGAVRRVAADFERGACALVAPLGAHRAGGVPALRDAARYCM